MEENENIRGVRPEREVTAGVPAPRREGNWKLPAGQEVSAQGVPWAEGVACPHCGGGLTRHGPDHFECPRHGMLEKRDVRYK